MIRYRKKKGYGMIWNDVKKYRRDKKIIRVFFYFH